MEGNFTFTAKENKFMQTAVLLPATMTLVCFICTVMSFTVAAFICLRDREAKDENEIAMRQQREDEFVSKTITMFYTIRAFNVFRLKEIISDKNDHRPAWLGNKDEIVRKLHRLGISLTEKEDRDISSLSDVFEVDADALLYFELERFAKAIAMYGESTLMHHRCIEQQGLAFPNLFIPGRKPIYEKDLIYTIYREMRQMTDIFVLLLTGIDAGYMKKDKIPKQFEMCLLKEELCSLEEFFYNYYHRIYSTQFFHSMEKQEAIELEAIENMQQSWQPSGQPHSEAARIRKSKSIESVVEVPMPEHETKLLQMEQAMPLEYATKEQPNQRLSERTRQVIASRLSRVRHSIQASSLMPRQSRRKPSTTVRPDLNIPETFEENIKLSESDPDLSGSREFLDIDSARKSHMGKSDTVQTNYMSVQPKAEPKLLKNPWSNRRRGKLKTTVSLEKNPFIYMVFKVLETLKGNKLDDQSFTVKTFQQVDRNFII